MPTPRPKHRTYCKTCQNFTIHSWIDSKLLCGQCDTQDSGYKISEVSPELIEQQRERYRSYKQRNFGGLYGAFIRGVGIEAMMNLDVPIIEECDAGLNNIYAEKRKEKERLLAIKNELYEYYIANYKHLNRNDKCSCGSGKKYKQCHLKQFNQF